MAALSKEEEDKIVQETEDLLMQPDWRKWLEEELSYINLNIDTCCVSYDPSIQVFTATVISHFSVQYIAMDISLSDPKE